LFQADFANRENGFVNRQPRFINLSKLAAVPFAVQAAESDAIGNLGGD
jgi:hypothetical protein